MTHCPTDAHVKTRHTANPAAYDRIVDALALLGLILSIIVSLSCGVASTSFAAGAMRIGSKTGTGLTISAKESNYDNTNQTIDLRGDVKLIYDQQVLSCDHAIVDRLNETIMAEGNLVISSTQAYVEGDRATLSYKDNTGIIYNGFVKSGPVIFEGKVIKKTGPQSYDAESASFTACTTCPTAWTFSGSRIQAEIGGYAYIKHARLRVANVPTIWLPYLIVPLKSDRQTGLLTPSIENNSEGGVALGLSFFWAMSRSQDSMYTFKYYSERHFKGLLNYRYRLTENSEGELNTGVIQDAVFARVLRNQYGDTSRGDAVNRRFFTYNHTYDLPNGFEQKLKLNYVSDLRYPRDFPEEILGAGDAALENRLTLTKNTERTHASLDSSYYINQLDANPLSANRDSVHRFPELRYDVIARPLSSTGLFSGVLFQFHSDYANFARGDLAWDDVYTNSKGEREVDTTRSQPATAASTPGVFDPKTDVIRTGQRIDLQPELAAPFRIGSIVDVLPTINFRHTQYSLNVTAPPGSDFDASPYRQYVRGRVSLRSRLSRVYGQSAEPAPPAPSVTDWTNTGSSLPGAEISGVTDPSLVPPVVAGAIHSNLYRHEIEPELVFAGVQDTHETRDRDFLGQVAQVPSFFDSQPISNSDFLIRGRGIQFDYEDRLTNRNTAGVFLSNRLVKKSWVGDTPVYRQVASLKLGQNYDFDEAKATSLNRQTFPYSDLSALLDVRLDHFETNTLVRYFPYHGKTNTSSRARLTDDSGRYIEMNVAQNYLITQNTDEALPNRTETLGFLLGFPATYLNFAGAIDMTPTNWLNASFVVKSWSILMNIKPPGNCWGILLTLRQDIGRKLDTKINFDYNFGGQPPRIAAAK